MARSAPWRRHYSWVAKRLKLKLDALTPGYGIRWNTEFELLRRLVAAQEVSWVSLLYFKSVLSTDVLYLQRLGR